ncbi:MAG TPA: hypothetical protein VLM37_03995, partial [Fibrobacteraceae bacterium]|nr:hypothetical protein [Fibrobacteraceae bacterium]
DRILVLDGQGGFAVDLPETLALEGVFQQVFSTPQVVFDPVGGGFRLEEGPGAPICLRGEGVAHIWTCRALRRKGWTLVEEGYPCVEVRTENGTPQWRILVSVEDVREVFSLEALLSALRNWKM